MSHLHAANLPVFGEGILEKEQALPRQTVLGAVLRHPWLMPYHRLAILMIALNLGVALTHPGIGLSLMNSMAIVNFTAALLIRQQYVINGLFALATSIPTSWPLPLH